VLVAIDAYIHFHDVHFYDLVGTSTLSAGNRFRAQAAAVAVGIALMVRPRPVGGRSRYSQLPVPSGRPCSPRRRRRHPCPAAGPLRATWAVPGKSASAVVEGIAIFLAIDGFVVALGTAP